MDLPSRPKGLEQDSPLLFPGGWAKSEYQSGPIQSSELMPHHFPAQTTVFCGPGYPLGRLRSSQLPANAFREPSFGMYR